MLDHDRCTVHSMYNTWLNLSRLKIAWLSFPWSSPSNAVTTQCRLAPRRPGSFSLLQPCLSRMILLDRMVKVDGDTNHNLIFNSIDLQIKCHQEGYDHASRLRNWPLKVELLMTWLMSLPCLVALIWILSRAGPNLSWPLSHISPRHLLPNKQCLIAAATDPASHGLSPRLMLISPSPPTETSRAATSAKTKSMYHYCLSALSVGILDRMSFIGNVIDDAHHSIKPINRLQSHCNQPQNSHYLIKHWQIQLPIQNFIHSLGIWFDE